MTPSERSDSPRICEDCGGEVRYKEGVAYCANPTTPPERSDSVPALSEAERAVILWMAAQPEADRGHLDVFALRRYYRERQGPANGWRGRSGRNGAATRMHRQLVRKKLLSTSGSLTDLGRLAAR